MRLAINSLSRLFKQFKQCFREAARINGDAQAISGTNSLEQEVADVGPKILRLASVSDLFAIQNGREARRESADYDSVRGIQRESRTRLSTLVNYEDSDQSVCLRYVRWLVLLVALLAGV